MGPNDIYRKTALGQAALKDRQILSDPRLRALLIMIDGNRAVHQLSGVGNAPSMLASLVDQGLVEMASNGTPADSGPGSGTGAASPTQGAPSPHPAPNVAGPDSSGFPSMLVETGQVDAPAEVSAAQLGQAKRQASRWLMDAAGPAAEGICIKIESAKTLDDLMTQATRAQALVTSLRGAPAGIKYITDLMAMLKAG